MMLDFGVEKLFRDAAIFPHMDGTTDISLPQDREGAVPRHRRQICRAGGVSGLKRRLVVSLSHIAIQGGRPS